MAQTASPAATSGAIISEFRFRGAAGTTDEYVEIVNTLDTPLNISGWAIQTNTGTLAIPNLQTTLVPPDTLVPPRGHFLFTGSGYSLSAYNAGDALIAGDISDDSGVALLNAAGAVQDAVGFASSVSGLREGAGLPSAPTADGQHVWMRDFTGQFPRDSADSSGDFVFLSVNGAGVAGTNGALTARLGSPNPEGLAAPTLANTAFNVAILDPLTNQNSAPNRVRSGSGDSGSLLVRRTLRNNSDRTITKVRILVTNITSQGSPFITSGQADVRLAGFSTESVLVQGQPVTVFGTSVDAPSIPATGTPLVGGGGLGSNLAFDLVLSTPLPPGASRAYAFNLQVARSGNYVVVFNILALPHAAGGVDASVRAGEGTWTGLNGGSIDGASQSVGLTVEGGDAATYFVRVRNRASASRSLTLHGTAGTSGWDVRYWDDSLNAEDQATDVTDQVTSPAGYATPVLSNAPDEYFELRVTITPARGVTPGAMLPVKLRVVAGNDAAEVDVVQVETTRRIPPPDIALRALAEDETAFVGLKQHDPSGAAQAKVGLTVPGAAQIYIAKIRNWSGFTQNMNLTAPADSDGWTTRIYDGLLADSAKEITSAVLGSGWPLQLVNGTEREVRVEVTPSQSATPKHIVPLTTALADDTSNKDVARIEAAIQKVGGIEVSLDHGKSWRDALQGTEELSVSRYSVLGVRARRGNIDAPWPNETFKPEWKRGAQSHFGAEVWLHFPQVTPPGEAGELVSAECGNSLSLRVRVLPE